MLRPHLLKAEVEIQRCPGIVHRRVLARLDGESQVLGRQVAQSARLGPAPGRGGAHQRGIPRRVPYQLPRVAQQQRLK